jgi:MinD superfamily P-loop ATPase
MQPCVTKRETENLLELTLRMFIDEVRLSLDKVACLKCDVCLLVCPRGAVAILPGESDLNIDIDPRLCVLCEICSHFCPVGAVRLTVNGAPKTIFADHRGLAPFYPKIDMDKGKCPEPCPPMPEGESHWCRQQVKLVANAVDECPKQCHKCLAACPRQAIVLDAAQAHTRPEPDRCLRCTQCLTACEFGAIRVNPQIRGRLAIDDTKCPSDCLKCINLCPVKAIVREGERVFAKVEVCSFCGVCKNICDQDAVTLVREEVVAEPGEFCHAWDLAVEKLLTS